MYIPNGKRLAKWLIFLFVGYIFFNSSKWHRRAFNRWNCNYKAEYYKIYPGAKIR